MLKAGGCNISSVISLAYPATDDLKFHLVDTDLWVSEANVHIANENAKYGDFDKQDATLTTNDVPFFRNFNLRDLFFRNAGAGADTTIYIVGIRMTEARKKELGIV